MFGLAVEFSYKAAPNGPLGQRARASLAKREAALRMIEDYDGRADLTVEPDLSDIPEFAWQFFGANVDVEEIVEDDEDSAYDDYGDNSSYLAPDEQAEFDELSLKYNMELYRPEDLMTLRRLDGLRWVQETYCVCDLSKESLGNYQDAPVSEPFVIWFEVDEVAIPSQSSSQYDDHVKQLGWNADKVNRGWRQSHGTRGRHKKRPWWSALAEHRRRSKKETRDDNQSSYSPREALTADHWLDDMAYFDGEMTFATKHPAGQLADAYHRLLMVNTIDCELKAVWAKDWAEFETLAQAFWRKLPSFGFYGEDADLRLLHISYYCGSYARRPEYDYEFGFYSHHAENHKVEHGWRGYGLELAMEAEARPYLDDMDFRNDMGDDYPWPDQDVTLPPHYNEEAQRRLDEDRACQAMAEADAAAWDETDFMEYERRLDAQDQAATLAQHGGPRGWKAGKVAHLRQMECA